MVNNEDRMRCTLIDVFGLSDDDSLMDDNENNPLTEEYDKLNTVNQEDMGCNIEQGPTRDTCFNSLDELLDFYQQHAKVKGFTMVRRSIVKTGGRNSKKCLSCYKSGKSYDRKTSTRSGCRARVNIILVAKGIWHVITVETNHGHDILLSMSRLMAAHRHMPNQLKRTLEDNDRAGLQICKNVKLVQL